MGTDGLVHPVKGGAFLQGAGGHHRPKSFAEIASSLATRALGHVPIHPDKAQSLLRAVIGWVDLWRSDETKIAFPVSVEAMGHVLNQAVRMTVVVAARMKQRRQGCIPDYEPCNLPLK